MASIDLDEQSYVETQQLLLAAAHHDLESLRTILKTVSANVQDSDTGYTGLHAAIASCLSESERDGPVDETSNNEVSGRVETEDRFEQAERTLKLLLLNGAIWNDLDLNNETPGCLAWRLGLKDLYEVMVDAGVRAELLLNRLDAYEPLDDEDEDHDAEQVGGNDGRSTDETPVLHENGLSAHPAVQDEETSLALNANEDDDSSTLNPNYLTSTLSFAGDRILDSSANGVMMSWESSLMERTASLLLPKTGLRVLNIGFGMGIFDSFVQNKHEPVEHHIVEAHPDVLASMKAKGWDVNDSEKYNKMNVIIHFGTWQSVLPKLVEKGMTFDAIFFDTFAEGYSEFREFFSEYLIALLETGGRWSFFHGLGADRQVCYDVYTKVCEMDIFEAGFEIDWEDVETPELQEEISAGQGRWTGVKRKYFNVEKYRLPICKFMG